MISSAYHFFFIERVKTTIKLSNGLKKHGTKFLNGEEIRQLRMWGSVAGSHCVASMPGFFFKLLYQVQPTIIPVLRGKPLNCRRETK